MLVARELCSWFDIDVGQAGSAFYVETIARTRLAEQFPQMAGLAVSPLPGGRCRVWCWEPEPLAAATRNAGLNADDFEIIPETLLETPRAQPRLLRSKGGFEGVIWRDAMLVATRFWPNCPDETQWAAFLRGAARPVEPPPSPEPRRYASGPRCGRDAVKDGFARFGAAGWAALAAILLGAPLAFQVGLVGARAIETARLEAALARVEAPLGDYRRYRAEALAEREYAADLSLFVSRPQLSEIVEVLGALAREEGFHVELIRVEGDRLRLEARGVPEDRLADLVARIDRTGLLEAAELAPRGPDGAYEIFARIVS